jgi:hypothetical protein
MAFGLAVWSWCGELLLSPSAGVFPIDQHEIKALFETTLHASLAGCRRPVTSKEEWQAQNRVSALQPHHANQLLQNAQLVLTYMAFPLLEAVIKRACASYVSFDGRVVTAFKVQNRQGGYRSYDPQGRYRERQFMASLVTPRCTQGRCGAATSAPARRTEPARRLSRQGGRVGAASPASTAPVRRDLRAPPGSGRGARHTGRCSSFQS